MSPQVSGGLLRRSEFWRGLQRHQNSEARPKTSCIDGMGEEDEGGKEGGGAWGVLGWAVCGPSWVSWIDLWANRGHL
eukprot:9135061-Pyramimonas_sp.AAC.1